MRCASRTSPDTCRSRLLLVLLDDVKAHKEREKSIAGVAAWFSCSWSEKASYSMGTSSVFAAETMAAEGREGQTGKGREGEERAREQKMEKKDSGPAGTLRAKRSNRNGSGSSINGSAGIKTGVGGERFQNVSTLAAIGQVGSS